MQTQNRLVKAHEVAQCLGVSTLMVQKMAKQRRIPSVQLSQRTIRFDVEAVLRALGLAASPTPKTS